MTPLCNADRTGNRCKTHNQLKGRPHLAGRLAAAGVMAACATAFGASAASADIVSIAAPAFTMHCPCATPPDVERFGQVINGLLTETKGILYAAVPFTTDGANVCSFTMIYRDNDADKNVVAVLKKKPFTLGGSAFDPPLNMAAVASTGADNGVRKASTSLINQRTLTLTSAFYYVQVQFVADTLEFLGVQIVVKPTCP